MEAVAPDVREVLKALASTLLDEIAEVSTQVAPTLLDSEPALASDAALSELFLASTQANFATVVHVVGDELDPQSIDAPPAAVHFARRLAQRGVPVASLVHAYRLGHWALTKYFSEKLLAADISPELALAAQLRLTDRLFGYADRVSEQVISVYEEESRIWIRSDAALQSAHIREILSGGVHDAARTEKALRYRLRTRHIGLIAWVPESIQAAAPLAEVEEVVARVAKQVAPNSRHLFVAKDERSAFVWLPVGERPVDLAQISAIPGLLSPNVRIAYGTSAAGANGFRTTILEAIAAQGVVHGTGADAPQIVPFREVAPITLLARDLELAASWVGDILGPLARDDENSAMLRHTVQVFLSHAGSLKPTADELYVHKNTVTYRLRKAEELMGRSLDYDRLRLELALLACQWLKSAVLSPAEG